MHVRDGVPAAVTAGYQWLQVGNIDVRVDLRADRQEDGAEATRRRALVS